MTNTVIETMSLNEAHLTENWCMPKEACKLLYLLGKINNAKKILELGTSIGYSTLWLAEIAKLNGGKVDTVDYFAERQDEAKQNIKTAGLADYVHFHQGQALSCLKQFTDNAMQFDFVFIDANKAEYVDYFETITPILISGGLFIADNTQSHREKMLDFIEAITESAHYETADIDTPNGLIIARKL